MNSPARNVVGLPGTLVRPAWLEARLDREDLRLVDLRDEEAFARGHIPGAVRLDLSQLGTSRPGLDNVLLVTEEFADLMERLGISSGSVVVAYDDQWGLAAARLLWALHYYGHEPAAVLDGGWDRWQEEDRPIGTGASAPQRGRFAPTPTPHVGATSEWLAERLGSDDLALLDTRTPNEFEEGHLPGAKCWDWFNAVPPGSWDAARDLEELMAEWKELGAGPEREVVVYCRSGMRAAHTYMALKGAGYPRVRLYDGSWQEWSMTVSDRNG